MNTPSNVYGTMLITLMRELPALPDYRTLQVRDIVSLYDRIRHDLERGLDGSK